ncbi:MAG: hypothetical protein WBIAU2_02800 [Wolbachia endosymbiont of Drosophila biauraria]|nr:MAG: hypothetical protein WBIAU2_02800 [Wolbachia endosymbiont of Drosophila biauraria]
MKGFVVIFLFINLCGVIQVAGRNEKNLLDTLRQPHYHGTEGIRLSSICAD